MVKEGRKGLDEVEVEMQQSNEEEVEEVEEEEEVEEVVEEAPRRWRQLPGLPLTVQSASPCRPLRSTGARAGWSSRLSSRLSSLNTARYLMDT